MKKMISYIASPLAALAFAYNIYAADPLHVKEVRWYTFLHGRHVSNNGSQFHSLELTAQEIGYEEMPDSILLLTTNLKKNEKPKLVIFLEFRGKIITLFDGKPDAPNSRLDGTLDAVIDGKESHVNLDNLQLRGKYQGMYDRMILAVYGYIQREK